MLALLAERPMHGYEIMQELSERTNGAWQPSPGSVYPALGRLREEGFISGEGRGDKQAFTLTDKGAAEAEALRTAGGPPWTRYAEEGDSEAARLRESHEQLGEAVRQVARVGSGDQQRRARAAMDELRRKLYLILAEEPSTEEGSAEGEES
jgi:DNA-binding PadR family transcriptional regulator